MFIVGIKHAFTHSSDKKYTLKLSEQPSIGLIRALEFVNVNHRKVYEMTTSGNKSDHSSDKASDKIGAHSDDKKTTQGAHDKDKAHDTGKKTDDKIHTGKK